MIDLQPNASQTEQHSPDDVPERLPWVSPRLETIKLRDAQAGAVNGGVTDFAGTHS